VETESASPFASSLLFDFVANYMYEGDTPSAERKVAALTLDRDLLRELLGQDELRDLIDADALEQVEADLSASERTRRLVDALHDVLRRVGRLTATRCAPGRAAASEVEAARARAARARARSAARRKRARWIAAEDAGCIATRSAPCRRRACPSFTATFPTRWSARPPLGRTHGPFTSGELRERYGSTSAGLAGLERGGELVRGELRRRHGARMVRPRSAAPPPARLARVAAQGDRAGRPARACALCPELAGRGPPSFERRRNRPAARSAHPAAGPAAARGGLGARRAPRRVGAYSPSWMDQLCAGGEIVWVGAGALGRRSGRVALYFREDAALLGPPPSKNPAAPPEDGAHAAIRSRLAHGACFFTDLLVDVSGVSAEEIQEALWDLAWAGEATNDAFSPLRSPRLAAQWSQKGRVERAAASRRRFGARRATARPQVQGRWSLTSGIFDGSEDRRTKAELLLERYGIVTREQVLAEGIPGGFSSLYDQFAALETLGICRRGYFIEGLGGAQFALPGAVERLRGQRDDDAAAPMVLAATDPAQVYGGVLKWPQTENRSPARQAGAYLVTVGAEPVLYVERGGKGLQVLVGGTDERIPSALEALADGVRRGRLPKRLGLERINGGPVVGSALEPLLLEFGFRSGTRKLTLTA
jgi:ATP-dependent Lhr-like helicase